MRKIGKSRFRSTIKWLSTGFCVLLLAWGAHTYFHHPQSVVLQTIPPSNIKGTLTIRFAKQENGESIQAAPLGKIDRPLTAGIDMIPHMQGEWKWRHDHELEFKPAENWAAGQIYQIAFDLGFFHSGAEIQTSNHRFTTPELCLEVEDLRVYQDPLEPQTLRIVGSLKCNYPIREETLSKHIRLARQALENGRLQPTADTIPLTVTYDKARLMVYLQSAPITLTDVPQFVNLMVDAGVEADKGPSRCPKMPPHKLCLPERRAFFRIKDVTALIQKDKSGQPEQILSVETTVGTSSEELLKALQVHVLPKDYPATPFQEVRHGYPWSNPGEVTPEVLLLAEPLLLKALPEEHPFPTLHRFQLQVQTPSYLSVQVTKGVTGAGNFVLAHDYHTVLPSPDYAREIVFLHQGSLLSKTGDPNLTIAVRGIPEIKLTISKVLPQQVHHLIAQTEGEFHQPTFPTNFGHEAISQIETDYRSFNIKNPCELHYTSIDLAQYLSEETERLGLFLLKIQDWDPSTATSSGIEANRLILITDMGLIVKDNADGSHDLFIQSIATGHPVAGGEVDLLGRNSLPIISCVSDDEGHVQFPATQDFRADREPMVYLVRNGADVSFIPFHRYDRQLNYSRFAVQGVTTPENGLNAYLFTERSVFRPGETVHVAAVVKNRFAQTPSLGLPLKMVLSDPQGMRVLNQSLSFPSSHLLTLDHPLPQHALSGQYQLMLYAISDQNEEHLLGECSFRVEEFLPDRLKIKAEFMPEEYTGWLGADQAKVQVSLWNLFGSPAAHHKVRAKMILTPKRELKFSKYPQFAFSDAAPASEAQCSFTEQLAECETDGRGQVEFSLPLEKFSQAAYQLQLVVEGFEGGGGRAVSSDQSVFVAPHSYLVGFKSDSDLHFLKRVTKASVDFLALDQTLQPIPVNNLKAEVMRIQTVSQLVKKPDGTLCYQSEQQRISESSQPFAIGAKGATLHLPTDQVGDYALVLQDEKGVKVSELLFSVIGQHENPTLYSKQLSAKLNREEYRAGETIEVQIAAPYTGAGLLTIERDKVYAFRWFKADANTSVQTIEIPADFMGTGYVNVSFVRDWDSDEIYLNPLSYTIAPFRVSSAEQRLDVEIKAPDFVRAGETLPITFRSEQPAQIILFAVDEGILQLDSYATPDPLSYFFRKEALTVQTSQIVDLILPKQAGKSHLSSTGGDKRSKLLAMHHNPFKRKTDRAVLFWSGILACSPLPQTISYPIPDAFNGTLRVMAVAVSPEKVGHQETMTQVQSHFIIQPQLPQFLAPGDTAVVTATISRSSRENHLDHPISLEVDTTPHLTLLSPPSSTLSLSPGEEKQVSFEIKVNEILGEAAFHLTASQGDKRSTVTTTLSIRPVSTYQTHLAVGSDNSATKTFSEIRSLYPEERQLVASASLNPLLLAYGLQKYLDHYPYNCTEQLICRAFAHLALAKHPFFELEPQIARDKFAASIQTLRERQMTDGGFSRWPGRQEIVSCEYCTTIAMDYLTEAKMAGYPVPNDLYQRGIQYLENFAKRDVNSLSAARVQAQAIYLLTRIGLITTNQITNLQLYLTAQHKETWKDDIISVYLAGAHHLMKSNQTAQLLLSGVKGHFSNQEDGLTARAQHLIILSRHFPELLKNVRQESLMELVQGIAADPLKPRSAAYGIFALSTFAQDSPDQTLAIAQIGTDRQEKRLTSLNPFYQKVHFDADASEIRFYNSDKKLFFYLVHQAGYNRQISPKPIHQGLEVYREYVGNKQRSIDKTELGEQIETHLSARSLTGQAIAQVAIVDLLPGGFEIVPHSVDAAHCDYVDVRDDRIIFYCTLSSNTSTFKYQLRAVTRGHFAVPPATAEAMDQPLLRAQGTSGMFTIL